MMEKKKNNLIYLIINIILGVGLPVIFIIGGVFYYSNNDTWKKLFEIVSYLIYVLPFLLIVIFILSTKYFHSYVRLLISAISIIGTLTSIIGIFFIENEKLMIDNDSYLSTKVFQAVNTISANTQQSVIATPSLEPNIITKVTPTLSSKIYEIIDFVNLVNNKIVLGLSNTKEYEENSYSYFCKSTPTSRSQIEAFFTGLKRKYGGYNISSFSLPAKFHIESIVQEPHEINNREYFYSQIERWEYTLYSGEKNERIDVSTSLYKYTILEMEEGIFCISNYEYEKPPEDYYLELESQ